MLNTNARGTWPNNSVRRVRLASDDWYLDKFRVAVVVNGVETVIPDKEDKPVHYFT